jgi:hypothetical protein
MVAVLSLYIANFVLGWGLTWVPLVVALLTLLLCVFTFRQLWKHSDHPAFHTRPPDRKDAGPSEN